MRLISEVLEKLPFYGYRRISKQLIEAHPHLTAKRAKRVMKRFGRISNLPGTQDIVGGERASQISLFTEREGNKAPQSGMGIGYNLHPFAWGLRLSFGYS